MRKIAKRTKVPRYAVTSSPKMNEMVGIGISNAPLRPGRAGNPISDPRTRFPYHAVILKILITAMVVRMSVCDSCWSDAGCENAWPDRGGSESFVEDEMGCRKSESHNIRHKLRVGIAAAFPDKAAKE